MPRPLKGSEPRCVVLSLRLTPSVAAALDEFRGDTSRADKTEELILRAVYGIHPRASTEPVASTEPARHPASAKLPAVVKPAHRHLPHKILSGGAVKVCGCGARRIGDGPWKMEGKP